MVPVTLLPPTMLDDDSDKEAGVTFTVIDADWLAPEYVPMTVAVVVLVTVWVVIVVLADDAPFLTVSEEGTGTALLLLESFTETPPDGAAALRLTVSVT